MRNIFNRLAVAIFVAAAVALAAAVSSCEDPGVDAPTARPVTGSAGFDATRTPRKNVLFFTYTATWCSPCYSFKKVLKPLEQEFGGQLISINLYTGDSDAKVRSAITETFDAQMRAEGRFSAGSVPTVLVDLAERHATKTAGGTRTIYNKHVKNSAKTGISVDSKLDGTTVKVDVTVGACESGAYRIGVLLVEDNVVCPQSGGGSNYNHTRVLRARGMENIFGESLKRMDVGETVSKRYVFDLDAGWRSEFLSVVVYTLYRNQDDQWVVANGVLAPANAFTGFQYEAS